MFDLTSQELNDIRRSPQWKFEVDRYIENHNIEDTPENRVILGEPIEGTPENRVVFGLGNDNLNETPLFSDPFVPDPTIPTVPELLIPSELIPPVDEAQISTSPLSLNDAVPELLNEPAPALEPESYVPDIGNQAKRKFGVEIELVAPLAMVEVCQMINEAGITCRQESYNHRQRDWWKIVPDASIRGQGMNPMEIVSRPLKGNDGLIEAEKVIKVLNDSGCQVNKYCGMHVHVEASRIKAEQLRNIAVAWIAYEHIIETMVPRSRRYTSERRYCQSIVDYRIDYDRTRLVELLENSYNKGRVIRVMNPEKDRMFKLNFQSLERHGTLEFRYHSGTCNAQKILNHIRFCIAFVNRFKNTIVEIQPVADMDLNLLLDEIVNELPVRMKDDFISYYQNRQQELAS